MGIFDRIKNAFLGTSNNVQIGCQQPKKSNYIPTYHIEDWQPKLKYPEYDKLFSLRKYLESINLSKTTISKVMNSSNPFGEAKNLFNGLNEKVEWSDMCCKEAQRMESWIKILSLWEAPPERIIESVFMYLLLRLGWQCHWDASKQKALNDTGLNYVLEKCKQNEYAKIIKIVDIDIICCLALAHLRSGKTLTEIVSDGLQYLDMNTTHNGSAHGSFYNLFGKQQIKGLIGKIIESAYINNKFSTKRLFLKEKSFEIVDTNNLKYDISKMKNMRGVYFPNSEDISHITQDVLSLNFFLQQANTLTSSFPSVQIEASDIVFRFDRIAKDEPIECCCFTYRPNTPTGKASKHPLKLSFYCKRTSQQIETIKGSKIQIIGADGIHGEIEYLQNCEIGKARIIIWYKGFLYIVYIINKKDAKIITKIETTNKNGNRITVYNSNKKVE